MLEQLNLQFGSSVGQVPLSFSPGSMTVFVGPNNAGKSLILREIESSTQTSGRFEGQIMRPSLFTPLTADKVKPLFRVQPGQLQDAVEIRDPITGRNMGTNLSSYLKTLQQFIDQNNADMIRNHLSPIYATHTLRLDGQTRLSLVNDQVTGDLQAAPQSLFQALFQNDIARKRLRDLSFEAFGLYSVIDPSGMRILRMRMSSIEPKDEERSLSGKALEFFQKAKLVVELSDGVKAYTGLIAAVLSTPYLLMLIDEPEAFLHPPLIRKLGKVLTDLASERAGNVLASTHSSEFLMGCIQSRKPVDVVRLTYKNDAATARLLSAAKLQTMMRDPFLRSTGVLSALFHDGAVVCEADMDRAFYQETNERLLEAESGGVESCLFLNSNGKDSIGRIVQPLREMGIPAAAIVDLDIIASGIFPLMQTAFVPPPLMTSLNTLKDRVNDAFKALGIPPKSAGIDALDKITKEAAEALLRSLEEYGIFVVPVGEIEKWLPQLGLTGHGPFWLSQAFQKMGTDPTDSDYVSPTAGDVWEFMRRVASWITNVNRKGIPD